MIIPFKTVTEVISTLLTSGGWKATKYLDERYIINATRRAHKRKFNVRDNVEIVLTIGRPNYAERAFIKTCKKAKESFPVKKIQIKFVPKKK